MEAMGKSVFWGCVCCAIALFDSVAGLAAETRRDTAVSYIELGDQFLEHEDFERAISAYGIALQFDPDFALAYFKRGFAQQARGNFSKAVADYTKTVEIEPRWAEAYANRAYLRGLQQDV